MMDDEEKPKSEKAMSDKKSDKKSEKSAPKEDAPAEAAE